MGTRPGQRADNVDPPLGGGGAEGGVPEGGEPDVDPGFDIDEYGGTGMTPEQRVLNGINMMNAAMGGFAPTVAPRKPVDKAAKHVEAKRLRAKARSMPKKGRMVERGREGRKVN